MRRRPSAPSRYFPIGLPWTWFFPFHCLTEVVAQTTTDACGNFCIWVPRFMIEWILRFRIERICYLELFNKPTVASVIAYLQGDPIGPDLAPRRGANVTLNLVRPSTRRPSNFSARRWSGNWPRRGPVKPLGLPIQANRRFWRAQPSPRPWLRHCPKPSEGSRHPPGGTSGRRQEYAGQQSRPGGEPTPWSRYGQVLWAFPALLQPHCARVGAHL